jgi:hypothetical protein
MTQANRITTLTVGNHETPEQGACIMEFVSLLAHESWSDKPVCASKSITAFCVWINDNGDQSHRDKLLLLAPQIVNTRDWKKEAKRAKLFSEFALWNKEKAESFGKSAAKHTEFAECTAKYAAKSVESAAQSAKFAAESADYAECAAKYAIQSAEYVDSAAEATARYALDSVEYAMPKSAKFKKKLYDKAIETLKAVLNV